MDKGIEIYGIKTQERIHNFLVDFITKNGYSPSVREICEGTDLKSSASVHEHLIMLERLKKIHMQDKKPRTISLVGYEFRKVKK